MILAAAAALALTACAKFETVPNTTDENAIAFGVYAGKAPNVTRATYGDITTANLKTSTDGFGVFAYYTQNNAWATTGYTPNFMYNQQVKYNDSANTTLYPAKWEYTPLKYWPNGTNSTVVESGTITDKLSFFAYAPQIATADLGTVPATGQGITALSANDAEGAPTVTFTVPEKAEQQIDLLWATPVKDQTKQTITGTINFTFKHALAKLNVQVQAVVDQVAPTSANFDDTNTSIILESIELEADGTKTGTLSLNDGTWSAKSGKTVVTYDEDSFSATTTVNGKKGFNVTEAVQDLNAAKSPMIIPGEIATGEYVITANYWVLTHDTALDGDYSVVQQKIKKTSTAAITFQPGYKYNVLVKHGLTNVSFDVTEVEAWEVGAANDVDLPINTTA